MPRRLRKKLAVVEMPALAGKASSMAEFCVVIVHVIWKGFWL